MKKTIDINQRIPLDTLDIALRSYLDGSYSNEYILEQLSLSFDGENRLKKSLRIVNKIIPKNPIISILDNNKQALAPVLKRKTDRNIILIALLNSAFPFSYDVLRFFGKFFSVQDVINADTIKKNISAIYGSNRATENGIYSVVPMFLEAGFFSRPSNGLYKFSETIVPSSKLSILIYEESFKKINKIDSLPEYQRSDPYFLFFE
ncbi:hypothetical protein [Lentimicrobium sp. S6]|uniref:hypothetical protein n=1 Tax=Lentimicrobium sp. S6 TaxID=2735872 RepID=UPI001554CA04|nr:hypothetical protein [Lentimicrobium sp. S6]NPD45123.1 hypothetical protein [Lentimicrobium sp. S6]